MSEWISVDELLPSNFDSVDVLINGKRRIVDCIFFKHGNSSFQVIISGGWVEVDNVTHWMLTPSVPRMATPKTVGHRS